jgi:hypothetical protein
MDLASNVVQRSIPLHTSTIEKAPSVESTEGAFVRSVLPDARSRRLGLLLLTPTFPVRNVACYSVNISQILAILKEISIN